MLNQFLIIFRDNQFVHPDPKGSELIIPAPFRVGVIRNNQFAVWEA
jgi:hypothetical protein